MSIISPDTSLIVPIAVKFCGITREADALEAIRAGASALGFNGYAKSKRYLDLRANQQWIRALPPFAVRVAVLVNPSLEYVREVIALQCIDRIQLHGDETPEFCDQVAECGGTVIKAVPLGNEDDLANIARFTVKDILLDAPAPGVYGGTGKTVDWELARRAVTTYPDRRLILAGGLIPENVAEATRRVMPYAVDTASGIEVAGQPGVKDPQKMRAFSAALRGVKPH